MTVDSAMEVFDVMATVIKPAAKGAAYATVFATRDAGAAAKFAYTLAQRVGVEPFVTDQGSASKQA